MLITSYNLDLWLESWARWCKSQGGNIKTVNFAAVSCGARGRCNEEFDEIELKIEVLVGRVALDDQVAAAALRLQYMSSKSQTERALLLSCSVATYRRKVNKCRDYILEFINV